MNEKLLVTRWLAQYILKLDTYIYKDKRFIWTRILTTGTAKSCVVSCGSSCPLLHSLSYIIAHETRSWFIWGRFHRSGYFYDGQALILTTFASMARIALKLSFEVLPFPREVVVTSVAWQSWGWSTYLTSLSWGWTPPCAWDYGRTCCKTNIRRVMELSKKRWEQSKLYSHFLFIRRNAQLRRLVFASFMS